MKKNQNSGLAVIALAGIMGVLAGCSGFGSNKVKIISISPDINTLLEAGKSLDIEVAVKYTLKQENGAIELVIQAGDNSSIASIVEPVKKGSGKLTLKKTITVPKTNAISVFTPLTVSGENMTEIVDSRVFKVITKK
ncbi:MAG: hypothetical protein NTX59_12015 [Elusimicrobia bacterium]|nr:hypothetical protein [Elusimicrobiota bacterium]